MVVVDTSCIADVIVAVVVVVVAVVVVAGGNPVALSLETTHLLLCIRLVLLFLQ